MLRTFLKNRRGATAIEYGVVAALIAVALIASLWNLHEYGLKKVYGEILLCGLGNGTVHPGQCGTPGPPPPP